jgi:hypothetical protein
MKLFFKDSGIQPCPMEWFEITYWLLQGKKIFLHNGQWIMRIRSANNGNRSLIIADSNDVDGLIKKGLIKKVGITLEITPLPLA